MLPGRSWQDLERKSSRSCHHAYFPCQGALHCFAGARTENILDTLVMLADRDVSIVNAFFFLAVVGMNVFGLFVTSKLGSVFRAVLLTARTASVSHLHRLWAVRRVTWLLLLNLYTSLRIQGWPEQVLVSIHILCNVLSSFLYYLYKDLFNPL